MENNTIMTKTEELFSVFESGCKEFSTELSQKASAMLQRFDSSNAELEILGSEKHANELCAHYLWDNGRQQVFLCPKASSKGVLLDTLDNISLNHPDVAEKLAQLEEKSAKDNYTAMLSPNTQQTVVLYVPRKMCQKREYLLDLILSAPDKAATIKVFIYMEDDARGVVTVNLRSRGQAAENFCASQLFCCVGKNADLILNEVQDLSLGTCTVTQKRTIVEDGGHLRWHVCELGSSKSASSLEVSLQGENSNAVVYGLYFPNGNQRMNLLTRQDHVAKHTFSDLHYKGALTDQASATWEGMVYVAPDASKADGYQKNENLLLSPDVHVLSKPGLEIITDDVKCSHGTTITDIDDDQIFYLTSRGIPEKDAERLVIQGFFDTVLNLISYAPIRTKLQDKIGQKMAKGA